MKIQQYQEDTLKKVDTIFALSIHPELRDEIKLVLSDSLKGQLEVVVGMAKGMKESIPDDYKYCGCDGECFADCKRSHNSALSSLTTALLEDIKRIKQ